MMRLAIILLALAASLLGARSALAHKPSDAYVTIDASNALVKVRADVALRDLEPVLALDANTDGALSWREVESRAPDLFAYVTSHLKLATGSSPCPFAASPASRLELVGHTDGTYVVLRLEALCATRPQAVTLDYSLLFERDALHRGLVRLVGGGATRTAIVSADERTTTMALADSGSGTSFIAAAREGVVHIAEGTDHLLFVLALLLPSVLRRRARDDAPRARGWGSWVPVDDFRSALFDVARIVTAFTIAHSVTLSLAALELIRLPSQLVETSIALSVVLAAANNIWPFLGRERWFAAFALGLLHGFGFSAVLADLGLARAELVGTLVGFNVGVEAGQLAFVALVFPLAFAIRRNRLYVPFALRGASALIAAIALAWAIERAFDLTLFG